MKQIPIKEFDEEINVIVIRKPKNTLVLAAGFQALKKLEILRIIESNIAAIGMHSFWGVPTLRVLGEFNIVMFSTLSLLNLELFLHSIDLSRNNITSLVDDNFKGQQNLLELNLGKNKMDQIPSATFKYLTVSMKKP
jgi:Leucine-rich repeat (LRR) protein